MRVKSNGINYTNIHHVRPSDSVELTRNSGFTALDASGEVVVIDRGGSTNTMYCTQGVFYPMAVSYIKSTGTTATEFSVLDDGKVADFDDLVQYITWVGSDDLAATNTSIGTRDSIFAGGSSRGPNELDVVYRDGFPVIGIMDGSLIPGDAAIDVVTCTPDFESEGAIIQWVMPRDWGGLGNPTNISAYLFDETPMELAVYTSSTLAVRDGAGTASAEPALVANTARVTMADWNGTEIGFTNGDTARASDTSTKLPTGPFTVGNNDTGAKPFNGALVSGITKGGWIPTPSELAILSTGLLERITGVFL